MKKLFYSAAVMALAFFAASCQQENLEPVSGGNTVTYTVQVPEALATKALGDEIGAVNELVYEVYRTEGERVDAFTDADNLLYHKTTPITDGVATFTLELINNQNFTVLFWAHTKDNGVYNADNLTEVKIESPDVANNVNAQAFVGRDYVVNCVSDAAGKVTLTRPVAQLNLGTTEASLTAFETPITISGSSVIVEGLSTTYDVAALSAGQVTADEYVYTEATRPNANLKVGSTSYVYVAMNYVGFAANTGSTVKVSYDINTSEGKISNTIENVPVKPNYRTNIVGNLITSTSNYTVELDREWATDGNGNMDVINNGIVKNVNGDYEVSNAAGLAYAMNTLFAEGGNFYLTASEYDLTNYHVSVPTISQDVVLNIYGETPVITRAATTYAGVTIIGLDGAFLPEVAEGATVTISGVTLKAEEGEETVLVGKNNGTVIVSETVADKFVADGNAAIRADVKSVDELNAALAAGAAEINLAGDIETETIIQINNSVIINGNNQALKTSANRAILLAANDIKVVINDLNIVSSAAVRYPSDVRGVNVDSKLTNVDLTLNNCNIDFTDITTCDWTYAVNVAGSGTAHKVTVIGGSYEGANVINVHGTKNTITVKNATLTSMYPEIEQYYGSCIWITQDADSYLYAEGNTFEGYNAYAINVGYTPKETKDNTDNTLFYFNNGKCYFASSAEKLQYVVNKVTKDALVKFANDIVGDVTLVQKQGVKITIDGDGNKYDGSIKVHSNSEYYADAALTIENVKFETSKASINVIEALENGSQRYSSNITVKDCSFTATGAAVNTSVGVQIKSSKNAKVLNCTADGMHSLLQAQSCDENVLVQNCKVNGKNGVAFKQVKAATVEGTAIEALEYGIRFDGNTDNYGITVKNNNVTAAQPFIVRKMTGQNNTIAIEGGNKLTTENGYQVVITNGSDDEAYVAPTGTYTLTGADDLFVYPRDLVVTTSEELVAALKAAKEGATINILADITISDKWDARYTGAKTAVPVVIDGHGHALNFTGEINDGGNYHSVFRFENDATVKNLKLDLSGASNANWLRAISAKSNLVVDNCEFIGKAEINSRGIIFGEGQSQKYDASVSITNSTFKNWKRGVTDNENGTDIKEVIIEGNTFDNANVGVSAYESVVFNENEMSEADVTIVSYTASSTTKVTALDNDLYPYGTYTIGKETKKFSAANVNAQEGFEVFVE